MRKFYVFNVNKETSIISKESPYILFKSFESIYNADRSDFNMAKTLYGQLSLKLNKSMLNQKLLVIIKIISIIFLMVKNINIIINIKMNYVI